MYRQSQSLAQQNLSSGAGFNSLIQSYTPVFLDIVRLAVAVAIITIISLGFLGKICNSSI